MSWLKHFLARAERTEQSQSIARVAITTTILAYLLLIGRYYIETAAWRQAVILVFGYLAYSVFLYLAIKRWPRPSSFRRGLAITTDMGVVSWAMHILHEYGSFLYPLYLWVIVGNGLRFGTPYLFYALVNGALGFGSMVVYTPYWHQHLTLAAGLLFGIVVLPLFYAALLREIEGVHRELARKAEENAYAATHDALTGLTNRYLLQDRLAHDLELARRHGRRLAVLFIDLDGFKAINDSDGHRAGDELLRAVAQQLSNVSRREDTVARYGGDEFVVILNDLTDRREAEHIATRFLEALDVPVPLQSENKRLTVSIGISLFPDDGQDADALLLAADKAMYAAKKAGGACYRFAGAGRGVVPAIKGESESG